MIKLRGKVMWIGRATVFMVGLAVTLALISGIATAALAAAPGDPFKLGKTNSINRLSSLVGRTAGFMLKVDNNGTGPALDLQVGPSTTLPSNKTVAPMKVDSQAQVVNLNSDELDGKDSTDFARAYKRTVIVSPVPGDPAASGTALLSTLSGIAGASQDNPYLLKIEPGLYDLGSSPLVMKQWVDIEGSGEGVTTIRRSGSPNFDTGTVVASNKSGLRFLTVENIGGATRATAVWNEGATSFRLAHVTAKASGGSTNVAVDTLNASPEITDLEAVASGGSGTNYGLYNNNSSPTMTDVTATASGGSLSQGVHNRNSSSPTISRATITASGAGGGNIGVDNENASSPKLTDLKITVLGTPNSNNTGVLNSNSSPTMTDITVRVSDGGDLNSGVSNHGSSATMTDVVAEASGARFNRGIENTSSSTPTMSGVTATASGGEQSEGVFVINSSPVIHDSTLEAGGASISNAALLNFGNVVQVNNSRLIAPTGTTIDNLGSAAITKVGASLLDGNAVHNSGGTLTCAGVYDENYTFFASTCP